MSPASMRSAPAISPGAPSVTTSSGSASPWSASLAEKEKLATATYIVRFKADFSRWFSGNPDMPKYKRWATQLANELKQQFDEEILWRRIKEDYVFQKETKR